MEWIDVKERLPEEADRYIVHCNVDGDSLVAVLWFGGYGRRFDDKVTHWMPLPNPPKVGVNDGLY